ncbi:MAG: FMN-binding protein [Pseudomonadales bacterium]
MRYWRAGNRTAWILDEIGKERPITLGVVVENNTIAQVKVLTYRESRGGEVRHAFFTNQFIGAMLNEKRQLDRDIDGVTGATMSVRAVTRVAQVALLFHQHVTHTATRVAQQ